MPFYDSGGVEVKAFSEEEFKIVEQKAQELEKAKAELKSKEEELAKFKEKDLNFSNLRGQKDALEDKIKKIQVDFEVKAESTKRELFEGMLLDHFNDALEALAGGDEELRKKIEHHYKRLSDPATTKVEVDKKLRDAWVLSAPPMVNSATPAFASFGTAPLKPPSTVGKLTPDEIELGKKLAAAGGLNLTDADFQK